MGDEVRTDPVGSKVDLTSSRLAFYKGHCNSGDAED